MKRARAVMFSLLENFPMTKLNGWKQVFSVSLLCAATAIASPAQTFTTLVNFDGANGALPYFMSLIQGTDGNYYGTTQGGGVFGDGTVFKITPGGTLTTLYSFCAQAGCTDGSYPYAGLVQASNGNFYGTTLEGGTTGYGTVFKITSAGTLTTLHSFDYTDGASPASVLMQASNGDLYGTTRNGGTSGNYGTVFKITLGATLTTLHIFLGYTAGDGANPYAGLVQGTNGDLYGTTLAGGTPNAGTIFRMTPAGALTPLYAFSPDDDGAYNPYCGLVQAANGDFYGTTFGGGVNGYGIVFKITPGGTLTTLYSFDDTDGASIYAGLVLATDGNFYGTTSAGGTNQDGTVFKITPGGTLTTLHIFDRTDGSNPFGGLMQATNGTFYGTTYAGGTDEFDGTVFSLSVGLGAFVETRPTSGAVGASVIILGSNLTGATSVTFNGTAAAFTVVSASEIRTTVPIGATTGAVKVTRPSGTLQSGVVFRVP
jgi:uncharacterized repeat protein (TIGR03803 family)